MCRGHWALCVVDEQAHHSFFSPSHTYWFTSLYPHSLASVTIAVVVVCPFRLGDPKASGGSTRGMGALVPPPTTLSSWHGSHNPLECCRPSFALSRYGWLSSAREPHVAVKLMARQRRWWRRRAMIQWRESGFQGNPSQFFHNHFSITTQINIIYTNIN